MSGGNPARYSNSGIVSPSLLAHILNSKYTLALPLYRQEQELARIGVPISQQAMANWIIAAHERWFSEFFQVLRRELIYNDILHADETTLMVLREPGRKAQQKSYVWVYRTSGDTWHPVVLYDYHPSRAGECASRFWRGLPACCIPMSTRPTAAGDHSGGLLGTYAQKVYRYAEKPAQGSAGQIPGKNRPGLL